jgi:hypothetical protein
MDTGMNSIRSEQPWESESGGVVFLGPSDCAVSFNCSC